jgi:mono/diheme cytochrome c family protein
MRATMTFCVALALAASTGVRRRGTAEQEVRVPQAPALDPSGGKLVYDQQCAACHYSASSEKKIGPGLAGLMKRAKFKNGMTANTNNLRRVIERGGKDMPPFRGSLTQAQLRSLIAYVKTL